MKLRALLLSAVALALAALIGVPASAQEGPPGPSAGEVLTGGLLNPRGIKVGPDGMLYLAEAGEGGDMPLTLEGLEFMNGFTGRISMIDPDTGERTTVADGLPSNAHEQFGTIGPADVAFLDGQLYYVQSHAGEVWGFPDWATGVYRVNADGTVDLIADIGAFNDANPVRAITEGIQLDIEPGGNPYAMVTRDGAFWVVDGNMNQLLKVTLDGTVSRVTEFEGHPVSTGITFRETGPFLVAFLGAEPFNPEDGKVVQVAALTGFTTEIASGASALTDVAVDATGQLFALQFGEQATAPGPPLVPFTGKVLRVNADGTFTPIVVGLNFATFMTFEGDTLFVVNNGLSVIAPGEIIKIENFSAVEPPPAPAPVPTQAPAPTPTSPAGIVAPDTGSDGYAGADGGLSPWLLAALAAGVALFGGGTLAVRRR